MLRWSSKAFQELGVSELYALLRLRQEVFVIEQNCPYADIDGIDDRCQHLLGWSEHGTLDAYARIVPPGIRFDEPAIGRVMSRLTRRGEGLGKALMVFAIEQAQTLYPKQALWLAAQARLEKFYTDLGFQSVGEQFMEDGIPHILMRLATSA